MLICISLFLLGRIHMETARGGSRRVAKSLQESILIAFDLKWKVSLSNRNFATLLVLPLTAASLIELSFLKFYTILKDPKLKLSFIAMCGFYKKTHSVLNLQLRNALLKLYCTILS